MPRDSRLALKRARRTGLLVCLAALVMGAWFLYGLAQQSYWAVALPVTVAVLWVLGLAFWIGHTIRTVRGIPPEADHYEGRQARAIALGICAASVAAAAVFLLGVWRQSYWAVALPVAGAVLGLTSMVFWIGWAIVTQRSTLDEFEAAREAQAAHADSAVPATASASEDPAAGSAPPAANTAP